MSGHVILSMHYHDNDGQPDQLEVVEAPTHAQFGLRALLSPHRMHVHGGNILVFGTPGLGAGRVAYEIYEWDVVGRGLNAVRLRHPLTGCEECSDQDPEGTR